MTNNNDSKGLEKLKSRNVSISSLRSLREDRTNFQKQLDTLARLLVDNSQEEWDMCVGVCLHGEGNGDKLYIASNKEEPISAKEYMENLKEFASSKSLENYEKLLESSIKQICCIRPQNRSRSGSNASNKGTNEETLNNFQAIAKDYNQKISLKQKPSWERLPKVAEELFQEVVDEKRSISERGRKWQYLTPWYDVGEFTKAIEDGQIEQGIIITIKKENNVELVGSSRKLTEEEERQKKKFHAEIKIIDKLYNDVNTEEELSEEKYIGLSKPTCANCKATIEILNNEIMAKYEWKVCGTHGSNEYTPLMSVIVEKKNKSKEVSKRAEEIKIEESQKGNKPRETSSELPTQITQLTNPVELLNKLYVQEKIAQIRVCHKAIGWYPNWNNK